MKNNNKLKFIDLFAGIGGFHQTLTSFGYECVLASEIDPYAIATYEKNYTIHSKNKEFQTAAVDVTKINEKEMEDFDVLAGGFPCQAFSKAGKQLGFKDPTKGTLFFDILRILREKTPRYIILENVRNLASHDSGRTWETIREELVKVGYVIPKKPIIISPHHLGIPQLRERVFIPGYFDKKNAGKKWIEIDVPNTDKNSLNAKSIINPYDDKREELLLDEYETSVLNMWDKFYKGIDLKIIGFPIWAEELNQKPVPKSLPDWKQKIITKNRDLFIRNKEFIKSWLKEEKVLSPRFTPTHRKFEWQAGDNIKSIWEGIIQFRPSGVRVKRPTTYPTLVAMVQTPIIGWRKRYISLREAANLQSFDKGFKFDTKPSQAYKQFGNSINVDVAKYIFKSLLEQE